MTAPLPCGCSRTSTYMWSICPDAERLWDRVADAHKALTRAMRTTAMRSDHPRRLAKLAAQRAYDEALAAYEARFVAPAPALPEAVERTLGL